MNDYQKEYMSRLEYNATDNPKDRPGWVPCDMDDNGWGICDCDGSFEFRDKETEQPVPLEEVKAVLGGKEYPHGVVKAVCQDDLVEHGTGALRESKEGKGRPDLFLAGFPRAIMAVCKHMDCELGRERNWEKGLPESSLISSQFRHLLGYTSGVSEDSPEYNLTANVWNALVLLEEYLRVQDGAMSEDVLDVEKDHG